jgi:hypothetical protein
MAQQLAGSTPLGSGNTQANANSIAASAANQTNATSSKLML